MSDSIVAHHFADLGEVLIYYVTAGRGPPVVLLHGWPSTWYEWRQVMPLLAAQFRVIAPDLRGLGDSSRPLAGYDKKTVAADLWQLLFGHARTFALAPGRPRLGRARWRSPSAAAHPEANRPLLDRRCHRARHRPRHLARRQALAPRFPHDARPARGPRPAGRGARLPELVLRVVLLAARQLSPRPTSTNTCALTASRTRSGPASPSIATSRTTSPTTAPSSPPGCA